MHWLTRLLRALRRPDPQEFDLSAAAEPIDEDQIPTPVVAHEDARDTVPTLTDGKHPPSSYPPGRRIPFPLPPTLPAIRRNPTRRKP